MRIIKSLTCDINLPYFWFLFIWRLEQNSWDSYVVEKLQVAFKNKCYYYMNELEWLKQLEAVSSLSLQGHIRGHYEKFQEKLESLLVMLSHCYPQYTKQILTCCVLVLTTYLQLCTNSSFRKRCFPTSFKWWALSRDQVRFI